jgi:hypothetical protein
VKVNGLLTKRFPWGLPTGVCLSSANSLEGAEVEEVSLLSPDWVTLSESEASSSSLTLKAAEVRSTPKAPGVPSVLKSAEHNSWKNITTLGESFFHMHPGFEHVLFPRKEAPESRARQMTISDKLMVTIAGNTDELT